MALNTNPFIEGIDPTATFGGYASVLLQLIREAKPSSTYGMILFDTTAPDVSGANAWRKTCIWINLVDPDNPTVNVYKEGGSPDWINVQAIIPANTVVTSMIANAAITLAKLSPVGGTANQLIRVNGAGNAIEFVSLSNLVSAGSINVTSLNSTGIPAGQFRFPGVYGPNVSTWYPAQTIIDNLSEGAIGADFIAPATSPDKSRRKFLTTALGDTFATWRFLDASVDLSVNSMPGDRIVNATFPLTKIIPFAGADRVLMTKGGVVDWIAPLTIQGAVTQFVTDVTALGALPTTAGGSTTLAHTLSAMPLTYRVSFYCETADGGYSPGDELEASNISLSGGDYSNAFNFLVSSASVIVRRNFASSILIPEKSGTSQHPINNSRWRLRLYAMKVA